MQKLRLPIQNTMLTAGYQNTAYRARFGFAHYGHDAVSMRGTQKVFASGTGKVLQAGMDSLLGNICIVFYPQTYNMRTKQCADLVLRYCHLGAIHVQVGDAVTPQTILGDYGNTGRYSAGAHLHVEADYDTKFFDYSATVGKNGTLIKAGSSATMCNPACVLYRGTDQTLRVSTASFGSTAYVGLEDVSTAMA